MARYWNFGIDHAANQVRALLAAFHLHHFGAAFFHEADRVSDRIVRAGVVGAVGHVAHQ